MISTEITKDSDGIHMLVTVHHAPGWVAQLFGAKPSSKSKMWHSERGYAEGIQWRDDEGHDFLDYDLWSFPYDCMKLYDRVQWRKKKYGETLA